MSDPREGYPALADPTPDDESGRGLAIVDALAEAWGIRERVVGKTVWARIRL
nr:ATP-binding protein [Streptomyces sabulosicollis]